MLREPGGNRSERSQRLKIISIFYLQAINFTLVHLP